MTARRGLTLVELVVVLTIVALLVASATVGMSGVAQNARRQSAIESIVEADRSLRSLATARQRAAALLIDLDRRQVFKRFETEDGEAIVQKVVSEDRLAAVATATSRRAAGIEEITYDFAGRSPTFAIELRRGDEAGSWLLFAGLTGQMTRVKERQDVEAIFRALR